MELTNDQYVTIGRIAEGAIESEEKICGYAHMPKSGNGYGNIGKFVYDQVYRIILAEQDKQLKREFSSKCKECGAYVTQPDIP